MVATPTVQTTSWLSSLTKERRMAELRVDMKSAVGKTEQGDVGLCLDPGGQVTFSTDIDRRLQELLSDEAHFGRHHRIPSRFVERKCHKRAKTNGWKTFRSQRSGLIDLNLH